MSIDKIEVTQYGPYDQQEVFEYLEELRESGVTTMYGARRWLMEEFHLTIAESKQALSDWMKARTS